MRTSLRLLVVSACLTVLGCNGPGSGQLVPPDSPPPMDVPPAPTPKPETPPAEILCTPGPNVELGYGYGTSIVAGPKGFGTVLTYHYKYGFYWVGSTMMLSEVGQITFERIGFQLTNYAVGYSIAGTQDGYTIWRSYEPQEGIFSNNAWFFKQAGAGTPGVGGQLGENLRVVNGSANGALWFHDDTAADRLTLTSGRLTSAGLIEAVALPWTMSGSGAVVSKAVASRDTVAVAVYKTTADVGGIVLLIKSGAEVRQIRIAAPPADETERVGLHDITATEDGYAVLWSKGSFETQAGVRRFVTRGYLASVSYDWTAEGTVASYQIPLMKKGNPWSWSLAWDGRRLALMGVNAWNGDGQLSLIRNDGSIIETAGLPLIEYSDGVGPWEGSLAYWNGTFGTLVADGEKFWFRNVVCR